LFRTACVNRRAASPAGRARKRLLVEPLEHRTLLAVDVWTGLAGSINADFNWSNPANWSLNAVPRPTDTAQFTKNSQVKSFVSTVDKPFTVGNLDVDVHWGGAITVNQPLSMTQGLALASGTFGGDGAMSIAGNSIWRGGTLRLGTGGLVNTGKFELPGGHLIGHGTLDNRGTILQEGGLFGTFFIDDGATILNEVTGTYDITGDLNLTSPEPINAFPTFINAGTLKKSAANAIFPNRGVIQANIFNSGTIEVEASTLEIDWVAGSSTGATFNVATGATLELHLDPAASFIGTYTGTGAGIVNIVFAGPAFGPGGATFNFPPGMLQLDQLQLDATQGTLTNAGDITLIQTGLFPPVTLTGSGTLINRGTITQRSDAIMEGIKLRNEAGAIYTIADGSSINHTSPSLATIVNAGTLRKTGQPLGSRIVAVFDNSGSIEVQTGGLIVDDVVGTSSGGTFEIAPGTNLDLNTTNSTTLTGGYTGNGGGVVIMEGQPSIGAAGASFNFPAGMLKWRGAQFNTSTGSLTNAGIITIVDPISGLPNLLVGGKGLINKGEINQLGTLRLTSDGVLNNQFGGLYNLSPGAAIVPNPNDVGGTFINAGGLQMAGDGVASLQVNLANSGGIMQVSGGTFELLTTGGTSTGGQMVVNAGAALLLAPRNTTTLTGGYRGIGEGVVTLDGGSLAIGAGGATFTFPPDMFRWSRGSINVGAGTLTNRGQIKLTGSFGPPTLTGGGTLSNFGTLVQAGSTPLQLLNGAGLRNELGGVLEFRTDAGIIRNLSGSNTLTNLGQLRKVAGTGTTMISATVDNTGTISVFSGTLNLTGPVVQVGTSTLDGGTWLVSADQSAVATLSISSAPGLAGVGAGAKVTLSGVNATFTDLNPPTTNAGNLDLTEARHVTTLGNFQNTGTLVLNSGGQLTGAGGYTQSASGILHFQVASEIFTGHNGPVSLAGSLVVDLAISNPLPGSSLTIISNGNQTSTGIPLPVQGTFAGLPEGAIFFGGAQFQITYKGGDGNDVVIRAIAPAFANRQVTSQVVVGSVATVSGVIERVKPRDAFILDVDWGDGSRRQKFSFPPPARTIHVRHHYHVAGTFTVSLRWIDQRGHFNTAKLPVVVLVRG
jgi:hypothetical protein